MYAGYLKQYMYAATISCLLFSQFWTSYKPLCITMCYSFDFSAIVGIHLTVDTVSMRWFELHLLSIASHQSIHCMIYFIADYTVIFQEGKAYKISDHLVNALPEVWCSPEIAKVTIYTLRNVYRKYTLTRNKVCNVKFA